MKLLIMSCLLAAIVAANAAIVASFGSDPWIVAVAEKNIEADFKVIEKGSLVRASKTADGYRIRYQTFSWKIDETGLATCYDVRTHYVSVSGDAISVKGQP